MKLISRIMIRVLISLTILFSIWAVCFYFTIINEVFDEVDDNLEAYSETIIARFNAGEVLPEQNNGTNNSYHIELISSSYIDISQTSLFLDDMIYIEAKGETEPARLYKTFFSANNGKTYRLLVYTPSIEQEDLIEAIFLAILYLFISLLTTIIIINIWVYKTSMTPLYNILSWLKEYKLGGRNEPFDNPTEIIEFKKLNKAIKSSIIRIENSYITQKEFIGNASHEMQTPLAICQTRLEALLETDLKEEQLREIIKTQQTIDYMKKVNKTLLLLTKIDNQQFIDVEQVDFNIIINSLIVDFEEVYASYNIKVNVVLEATLIVNMNPILARTLIINLIKNAFVHNIDSGEVNIYVDNSKLTIENSGEYELDKHQLFKRFYQGNKKKLNSTGLGLAIIYSICKEREFDLEYRYLDQKHQFIILF